MGELLVWSPDEFQCMCESHGGRGETLLESICKECSAGWMLGHPGLPRWLKCTICGFSCVETPRAKRVEMISWEDMREKESDESDDC